MMSFDNEAVIWFAVGFVLFLLEFVMPGFILFFFAIGAWIVAVLTLFIDLSINYQLIIFLISSVLSILLFRKWMKNLIWIRKDTSEIEDELIGKTVTAETFIGPGINGKVEFNGTSWEAQSEDRIEKGERATIIGNDSILLIIKSIKL